MVKGQPGRNRRSQCTASSVDGTSWDAFPLEPNHSSGGILADGEEIIGGTLVMPTLDEYGLRTELFDKNPGGGFAVLGTFDIDFGETFGFGQVGSDELRPVHHVTENRPGPALQKGGAIARGQNRVDHRRNPNFETREGELDAPRHIVRGQHADFNGRWGEIGEQGPQLIQSNRRKNGHHPANPRAVLQSERGDHPGAVHPISGKYLEVGLQAGAASRVRARNG